VWRNLIVQHALEIKREKAGEVDVVCLGGSLDTATTDVFSKTMQPLSSQGARVVVDCMGLTYVNSMCFALFNKYNKECEAAGGKLVYCCIPQKIAQIIHLLGLHETLQIAMSREEAIKKAGG